MSAQSHFTGQVQSKSASARSAEAGVIEAAFEAAALELGVFDRDDAWAAMQSGDASGQVASCCQVRPPRIVNSGLIN